MKKTYIITLNTYVPLLILQDHGIQFTYSNEMIIIDDTSQYKYLIQLSQKSQPKHFQISEILMI